MSDALPHRLDVDGAGTEAWVVAACEATERLSTPTRVVVRAWTPEPPDLDALIGKRASLELAIDARRRRAFHGVVLEASESAHRENAFEVELVIESALALLRIGRDHRIYQETSVPDVIRDVLSRAGVDAICEWAIQTSYEPHANIVQYGESDYAFVRRLLAEEGIGYFVLQDEAGERVVFFDDDHAFEAIEGETLLTHVEAGGSARAGLFELAQSHRVASDQVMLNDYDLAAPATDLRLTAEAEASTAREVYLHPGGYVDPGRGQRLTDRRLEALRVHTHTYEGESNVPTLMAGRFFSAAGSPRAEVDGDYLVIEVRHRLAPSDPEGAATEGVSTLYDNRVTLIPVDHPYRPEAAGPGPTVAGVQHAWVTVPGGEEIHTDDYGRCKVRFPWDRSGITDDKSSTWLRVNQKALGGSMIHPRVDFEVLVDFELGDLDRPAITGHLYEAEHAPPYALPGGNTRSSLQTATTEGGPGANELRFEDAAGGEEIFVHASKDLTASVDHDTSWSVGSNQTRDVGSNETWSVVADHSASVAGSRSLEVGGDQSTDVGGEYGDGTGGSLDVSVGGNRMVQAGGDHSEDVGGSLSRTVGSLQCLTGIAGYARTVVGDATIDVGAAWAELAGGARGLDVAGSYSETVGALKFIKAKDVSVACSAAYVMNAAAEIVKAGGGRTDDAKGAVALSAGGAVKVKAKNIVFEAKSKLVFRGGAGSIEISSAGMVKVKAPKVKVKNAKALNQIMHKTG
ncbi:MAG TPA: type VI secretion system tip protein TssI/VgrG [Sandaracinaceae bacterium LLY-WYZ-13_1]|nr:type VI secretion system tip protein TssI/VgrG [Sandaracinaceae bacterium LLY-WYZ-13_1]